MCIDTHPCFPANFVKGNYFSDFPFGPLKDDTVPIGATSVL